MFSRKPAMRRSRHFCSVLLWGLSCYGQTKIDLPTQSRDVDFTQAAFTKPVKAGTGLPATCGIDELYLRNDASPGSNLFECTATNTWTLLTGGTGGGTSGGVSGSQISDLSVTRDSTTQITSGALCSPSAPCLVRIQDTIFSYTNAVTATNPTGSGTVWVGIDPTGVRTAWNNLTGLTCTGLVCVSGAAGFPPDTIPLARCTVTSGAFDSGGCTDLRALYSRDIYVAGPGLIRIGNQFSVNTAQVELGGATTVAFGSAPVFDLAAGSLQSITLTGNVTSSSINNPSPGYFLTFKICQDATGSRTFVWPANVKGNMTVGTTASKCSVQSFVYDGTQWYATGPGVVNL
jgi:hypothetical protein